MRRLTALAALGLTALAAAAPAPATIHEKASLECGNASGFPPGQTPAFLGDTRGSEQSDLRALLATGVLVGVGPEGPILDTSAPAYNGNSGEAHCAALQP